jgi:two-component system sensor histidine kinase CiaH
MPNIWKKTALRLTVSYSLVFLGFLALFSVILYFWVNSSLGDGYIEEVSGQVGQAGQIDTVDSPAQKSDAARIAANIAIQHFRDILLTVDVIAIMVVPFGSYILTRRTLRPLIASQEQQKQFIANASHELRTPLAVLSGEFELALRKTQSAKDYKKTIVNSKLEIDHMTRLTKELLLLSQLDEVNTMFTDKTIISMSELMVTIKRQLSPIAKQQAITIKIRCPETITVIGNAALLKIAISNIVDNAIKYSDTGSEVTIIVKTTTQGHTTMAIKNRGDVIPISRQEHIFDRFYRAENSRSSEGFGLGLAISQKILTMHGGRITFTSTDDETVFDIFL